MVKRFFKKLTVHRALLLCYVGGIIIPLLVFVFSYTSSLNSHLGNIEDESANLIVSNNAEQLRSIIERISYTSAYLCNNRELQAYIALVNHSEETNNSYRARNAICEIMRNISNSTLYKLNPHIAVITKNGYVINLDYSSSRIDMEGLIEDAYFKQNRVAWTSPLRPPDSDLASTWPIYNSKKTIIGYLLIQIPQHDLWNNLSNHPMLNYRQDIYAYNQQICTNNLEPVSPSETYSTFTCPIENWGISLVVKVPTRVFEARLVGQILMFVTYCIALLAVLILVINLLSSYISRPVRKTADNLARITAGDYSTKEITGYFSEIVELNDNLNKVAVYISDLITRVKAEAALKDKMRYDALLSQINPHFIYNSLSSIRWIVQFGGSNLAMEMLTKLGNILHYSFGRDGDYICIKDELAFLNDYVEMLQIRFGNNLQYHVELPEALGYITIPRFCIQPIIENSIMHGIFSMTEGQIRIVVSQTEGGVFIDVCDNGAGMTQEYADALLAGESKSNGRGGVGLVNVHHRLKLIYGQEYGLTITSALGHGVCVTIHLPLQDVVHG